MWRLISILQTALPLQPTRFNAHTAGESAYRCEVVKSSAASEERKEAGSDYRGVCVSKGK